MTKALILMSAALLAACGSAATPAPRAHEPAAQARPLSEPAARSSEAEAQASASPAASESASDGDRRVIAELERAFALYQAFVSRAGSDASYAEAVARSKERMADIHDTLEFMKQGLKDR